VKADFRQHQRNAFSLRLLPSLAIFLSLVVASEAASGQARTPSQGSGNSNQSVAVAAPQYGSQQTGSGAGASFSVQAQSPFSGSVPSGSATSAVIPLSFTEAINRGLRQNLGLLLSADSTLAARGQKWHELSNLLPNVSASVLESIQETSLAALGLKGTLLGGGRNVPSVIGPFNYFDSRIYLNQSLFNFNYIEKTRAALENEKASQFNYKDARELVVLAVGNSYLRALSGAARVETAEAQVKTAQALSDKAIAQQNAGVSPAIDALRAKVELQSRQQQLIASRTDFAKQKLTLARIIGLPSGQEFALSDTAPYEALATQGVEESLHRAYALRADYQAAQAQMRAAELNRHAATAEHLPSLDFSADYGAIGVSPRSTDSTYRMAGVLNIPIFQGGKAHADALEAEATLRQSRAQVENLRGQIDYEVRTAMLDLEAAADQVAVARSSVDLAQQTLTQAQDRFAAGVTDNLEVIQAQEALASANENYISGLYAHNVAKVEFAKAIGYAEEGVKQYLRGK